MSYISTSTGPYTTFNSNSNSNSRINNFWKHYQTHEGRYSTYSEYLSFLARKSVLAIYQELDRLTHNILNTKNSFFYDWVRRSTVTTETILALRGMKDTWQSCQGASSYVFGGGFNGYTLLEKAKHILHVLLAAEVDPAGSESGRGRGNQLFKARILDIETVLSLLARRSTILQENVLTYSKFKVQSLQGHTAHTLRYTNPLHRKIHVFLAAARVPLMSLYLTDGFPIPPQYKISYLEDMTKYPI